VLKFFLMGDMGKGGGGRLIALSFAGFWEGKMELKREIQLGETLRRSTKFEDFDGTLFQ